VASFLKENAVEKLPSLTEGMFGYSLTRPAENKEYFYGILDACERFRCPIEGWHTESGPGVFEAVSWDARVGVFLTGGRLCSLTS
jgi:glutamine synthetase